MPAKHSHRKRTGNATWHCSVRLQRLLAMQRTNLGLLPWLGVTQQRQLLSTYLERSTLPMTQLEIPEEAFPHNEGVQYK